MARGFDPVDFKNAEAVTKEAGVELSTLQVLHSDHQQRNSERLADVVHCRLCAAVEHFNSLDEWQREALFRHLELVEIADGASARQPRRRRCRGRKTNVP